MKRFKLFIGRNKKFILFLGLVALCASSIFAQSTTVTSDMDARMYKVVNFFNGGWVKALCCIMLIGECLGLLFAGGQNPQIFKKFLPFIIGTVLFMCAGKIVTIIWGTQDKTFEQDLTSSKTSLLIKPEKPNILKPNTLKIGNCTFQCV